MLLSTRQGKLESISQRLGLTSSFLASRFDDGYITWVNAGQLSWTLRGLAMGPDTATEIGTRPISQEPMVPSSVLFY